MGGICRRRRNSLFAAGADLKGLKRPSSSYKNGCGGKGQQEEKAHADYRLFAVTDLDSRAILFGIHGYGSVAQCQHCRRMERCLGPEPRFSEDVTVTEMRCIEPSSPSIGM